MFRRSDASKDVGKKPTQRVRSSVTPSEPPKPATLTIIKDPSAPRKLSIQMRRRRTGQGEKRFWWPKFKKPPGQISSWKIATFFERHERFNAWPQKPWTTTGLEDSYFKKRIICGCIPLYKKTAHGPNPYEDVTAGQLVTSPTSILKVPQSKWVKHDADSNAGLPGYVIIPVLKKVSIEVFP